MAPKISVLGVGAALALARAVCCELILGRCHVFRQNLCVDILRIPCRNKPNTGCAGFGLLLPAFADTVCDNVLDNLTSGDLGVIIPHFLILVWC
ncbi:hypothetical protein DFH08DRAFT_121851 [Mycena albidolilacea]|uniref:Secreted protein n=1 Tax=Mycena albidolilacea TaxID=1033008 RepID=A0AAD6YX57_9AGAR|nr:hypothetical protein DFH08DRAFT_121851 [Mycena albidolilacea]